ncbi:hypothetical protein AOLI_G00016070 [Acnodon oligacanthus]
MLNAPSLTLLLLLNLSGLEALVITQEKAMSVKLGENIKVSCRTDAPTDYALTWYQQKPVYGGGTEVTFDHPVSPPSLLLLAPSQSPPSGSEVSVVCIAQGFRPDGAALSWTEDSTTIAGPEVHTGPSQRQSDGTLVQSSVLKLRPERWSSGRSYTCHLTDPALTSPLRESVSVGQCS